MYANTRQSGTVNAKASQFTMPLSTIPPRKFVHERMKNGRDEDKKEEKIYGAFSDIYFDKWHLGELPSNSVFIGVCSWIDKNSHSQKTGFWKKLLTK